VQLPQIAASTVGVSRIGWVTYVGVPKLNVTLAEVGLGKQSEIAGVRGPTGS